MQNYCVCCFLRSNLGIIPNVSKCFVIDFKAYPLSNPWVGPEYQCLWLIDQNSIQFVDMVYSTSH